MARADTLSVELKDNMITIEAVNASLIAIADRVSKLTGIPISYTDGSDSLITISIIDEPLKKVVTKLSENNVIRANKVNGDNVITEVIFLLPDTQGGSLDTNLPSGEPVDEVYVEPTTDVQEPVAEDINNPSGLASEPVEPVPSQ